LSTPASRRTPTQQLFGSLQPPQQIGDRQADIETGGYDRAVIRRARADETARQLMSVPGVGAVVVLGYMTGVEDPTRFRRSSSVAAYFGMTPARRD
jgi:transposase